jgi:serine-type D-Ala-D-Ala carboxypeptidase/endopeptidase
MQARKVPGMVAGLVRDGRPEAWGLGRLARDVDRAPDADTVFEIGSITKVFTATVLAATAGEGTLALDEPIRPLLGDRTTLPDWSGREITLLHLATHTSTLPRASRRMMAKALRHPSNPYRDYSAQDLYADLAQFTPGAGLGRTVTYSNLGVGLLGHLLELQAGRPFEALVRERVCTPLGLADTTVTLDAAQRARLAQGYWFGKPVGLWDLPVLAGAGALRSTMRDLLVFLQAQMAPADTPLGAALRSTHEPRAHATADLNIGLGWHLTPLESTPDHSILWHRGETGGMRGFVGFIRERAVGLALLANASAGVDELGLELLARLL